MKRILIIILLFISFLQGVSSQIFQQDYYNRDDSTLNAGELFLDLPLSTWFYNNEYFNPFYKGYTLTGANIQPRIVYQSRPGLKFSAGIYLHRYYGDAEKTFAKPLFNIEYKPRENFSVLMGTYNGGENHGLNEALFSFENHLTDIIENGILIRYSNPRIKSETWLNWESFIMPGDTFQEKFTAGSINDLRLLKGSYWNLSLPFTLLAHHSGGQINANDSHIETLINICEGLKLSRKISDKPGYNAFAELTLFHSLGDYIPSGGNAYSFKAGLQLDRLEANLQYFNGRDFISFAGNPLFRSWTETGDPLVPFKYGGNHELFNFKAGFRQKIGANSFLFLRFEGYYFTSSRMLDYSYSLHFQVRDFLRLRTARKPF
jgi:hypothetical protein